MLPWLMPGVRLLIEPPPFVPSLTPGDLLLAHAGGCLRLHRLIEERPSGLILKGDAVLRADPLVTLDMIHGRVVTIEGPLMTRYPLRGLRRRMSRLIARTSRFQWRLLGKAMSDS